MIKVLFFARLQEDMGISELLMDGENAGQTAQSLRNNLIAMGKASLADDSIKVAINQSFCDWDTEIKDGDEVAFMPPVTGG